MNQEIALALIEARETAGYTQRDVAQLLSISQSVLCKIEYGLRPPSIMLAAALSVLYDKPFAHLFADLLETAQADIAAQLLCADQTLGHIAPDTNRGASFQRLRTRLHVDISLDDDDD